MSSTRLTAAIRENIRNDLLRHRYGAEAAALRARKVDLAHRIWEDVYSPADRETMLGLPEGWLDEHGKLRIQFSSGFEELNFSGRYFGKMVTLLAGQPEPKVERHPMPAKDRGRTHKVYEVDHELDREFRKLDEDGSSFLETVRQTMGKIRAALDRCGSTSQLMAEWPDAAPFVKKYEKPKKGALTLPVDALNTALDLPVAEEA